MQRISNEIHGFISQIFHRQQMNRLSNDFSSLWKPKRNYYITDRVIYISRPTVAAHLRGGSGDEPPQETSAAGPADSTTEHDSRVRCSRRL